MIKAPYPHHHERRLAELVTHGIEAPVLFAFPDEAFDLPDAREIIVEERVHRRGGAPLEPVTPMSGKGVPERTRSQQLQRPLANERKSNAEIKHQRDNHYGL